MSREMPMMVPNREMVNSEQVATLLHIANSMQAYLLAPHREFDAHAHPELDGGAMASATVTFGNVCKRLDDLLADSSRWTVTKSNELYASIVALQEAQRKHVEAQTKAIEASTLPSYQLRPVLLQHEGIFIAVYGDARTPGMHIIGRGLTPESALADFDQAFKRTAIEQYQVEVEPDHNPKKKAKSERTNLDQQ